MPADMWYMTATKTRFVVDPCEWDAEYYGGIKRIEESLAADPQAWNWKWVWSNTCRCVNSAMYGLKCSPDFC
jgi:hypothetical protein